MELGPMERLRVAAVGETVLAHREARQLLEADGLREHAVRFTDRLVDPPILAKAMLDKVNDDCVIDLKSAKDPTPRGFAWAVADRGYHRQQAFYKRALEAVYGYCIKDFLFIAVGSGDRPECYVHRLKATAAELGDRQVQSDLARLAMCRRMDDWPDKAAGIHTLDLPRSAYYEE